MMDGSMSAGFRNRAVSFMLTIERVAALHRVVMFADIPGSVLAAVARQATEVVVDPGTAVFVEGAVEDHLFVIVDGRIRIHNGEHTLVELARARPSASSQRSSLSLAPPRRRRWSAPRCCALASRCSTSCWRIARRSPAASSRRSSSGCANGRRMVRPSPRTSLRREPASRSQASPSGC